MEVYYLLVFFYPCFCSFGYGFLFDTSTPSKQIQSTPDKNYAALYELLLDEKKHRMDLEQRIQVLEKLTGNQEQNRKMEQLSNFVLQLQTEIQNLKMQSEHAGHINETIDIVARAEISNISMWVENKYQTLDHNDNELLNKQHLIDKTVADLQRNFTTILQMKGIDQIQLLDTLRQRVDSVESRSNMIMSNANARGQDFMALYNKTIFVENNLQNRISNVENNFNMTLSLQFHNLSNELERTRNISSENLSNYMSKQATSMQNLVTELNRKQELSQHNISVSLSTLNRQLDKVNQELNVTTTNLKSSTKKVAVTACLTESRKYIGEIIPFSSIRSIVGINKTSQLSNGTFICKDAGLYLITVTNAVFSSDDSHIGLFKNNVQIVNFYDQTSTGVHTSTDVVSVEVNENDILFVKSLQSPLLYSDWSCLTILKIA